MSEISEYPIKKKDNLGRLVYIKWNDIERSANVYWDNTENIKIKYKYYNTDVSFDAYDKAGKNVISYNGGRLDIKLDFIYFNNYDNGFNFRISKVFNKKWIEITRKKSRKNL